MEEKRIHAGYEILENMQLHNQFGTEVGIVLGYNPKAPCPYVTWECNKKQDSFIMGHYFSNKEAAVKDFFERGLKVSCLDLKEVYQKEQLAQDLHEALVQEYGENPVKDLVKSDSFLQKVFENYEDLAHGANREYAMAAFTKAYNESPEHSVHFDEMVTDRIRDSLKAAAKESWYVEEDARGYYEIDISADYRDTNAFLLQPAYDNRNHKDLFSILCSEIDNGYETTIRAYEDELLEKAGFDYASPYRDQAEEILHETITFYPDYVHFLRSDDVKLNLLVGTKEEMNKDFSDIQESLKAQAEKAKFKELEQDAKECGETLEPPDNGLLWLIHQQGYTLADLQNVKEAYDAFFCGSNTEQYSSYSERYEEFKKTHSPFLTSVCQELENHNSVMGCLTVLVKSSLDEYCKMFERSDSTGELLPKEIVLGKDIELGIFNPWLGSGSCLDLELEKELILPNDMIYDSQIEGVRPEQGYSLNAVYGLLDSCWKPAKEVRSMEREPEKASLDDIIKDADGSRSGQAESAPERNIDIGR